uniref:Ig-like domain-containing protein n=1 Tax=Mola mola TaxID=94237 RepID=A0A3Q3WMQ9_MOLML
NKRPEQLGRFCACAAHSLVRKEACTTALIQTQQTVLAAVTEDARVSCQLTQTKDVVQVNWQKYFPVRDKFLASYHEVFGQTVSSDSRGKVEFAEADLQSSSIIIGNVTEQDDGCYHCVFNIFPDGAFTAKTCLQVYGKILYDLDSDSSEKTLVSCSATARPAPTVTLRVLQQDLHLSEHSSVSVNNTNGTVTVTATALLSGLHDNSVQVGCAGRVLSASQCFLAAHWSSRGSILTIAAWIITKFYRLVSVKMMSNSLNFGASSTKINFCC